MIPRRKTHQKLKIMEYLSKVRTHPTAEVVYGAIKKDLPTISLATVYRNLNLLAEEGQILKLEINNEYHFDAFMCGHQHLVCKKCGLILDAKQEEITNCAIKKLNINGFKPECVNIIIYGKCKKCS